MNLSGASAAAVRKAAVLRANFGIGPAEGLCPYDLAIKLKIKVSFLSAPSLEGMYSPDPRPAIILNSERPAGRRRFTCGHEIGHHVFEHGYRIDELSDENSSSDSPEEQLAQRFSSALLMPKIAVDSAFARRGWSPDTAQPAEVFIVAQELGVGFTTLITNAEVNMKAISKMRADELRRASIPKIRAAVAGMPVPADVFQVDKYWIRPTVDVEVGDVIVLPKEAEVEGACVSRDLEYAGNPIANRPGTAQVNFGTGLRHLTVRVSKPRFNGLARYRHLEDTHDDV